MHASQRNDTPAKSRRKWIFSLLVWTFLLLLFATQNHVTFQLAGRPLTWLEHVQRELPGWGIWALLAPFAFAVAQRFPVLGRHRLRNLLLHAPMALLFLMLHATLYTGLLHLVPLRPDIMMSTLSYTDLVAAIMQANFAFFLLIYGGIITAFHVLEYQRVLQARELQASILQTRLANAQLDLLRMQIQPHFLFNTLHSVSALMARDVQSARRMITNLSDLLRLSIDRDDVHEVPLQEELTFLGRYVEIQEMRFGDRLRVTYDIAPETQNLLVPQLLLQPLVENALQHGIAKHARAGCVRIQARRAEGTLCVSVQDDGPGSGENSYGVLSEGVGLSNTRARLEKLYGAAHQLIAGNAPEGGFRVLIHLPARQPYAAVESLQR